jgi:hypothetical protein
MAGDAKKKRASKGAGSASKQIDKLIAKTKDWRGDRLAEIRKLIHEVNPEVVEDWKWMGTPCWSHNGMYLIANPHKDKVKLTFFHGAQLPDPKKLFNAGLGGGKWRAIDIREGDKVDKSALKALLRAAVKYNATHEVPRSKGSRKSMPKKKATKKAAKKAAKKKAVRNGGKTAAGKVATMAASTAARTAARKTSPGKAAARPRLLSGGNPQIAMADGDAPVQAYIAAIPGWKRDAARRLDALIVRTVPGVRKAVKWNSPFYGTGELGWFLAFHCITKYIKVNFFRGASLDPLPPVASKDKNTRYVHIYEDEPLDEAQLASWIRQAAARPGWIFGKK